MKHGSFWGAMAFSVAFAAVYGLTRPAGAGEEMCSFRLLWDGLTLSGLLQLALGLLRRCAAWGAFDGLRYGFRLMRFGGEERMATYHKFVKSSGKGKNWDHLMLAGSICMGISLIFLMVDHIA